MSLLRDVIGSGKSFARTPGLTLALIFTIALGTGCTIAINGFVHGLLSPLPPVPDADRVVSLFLSGTPDGRMSPAEFHAIQGDLMAFEWTGMACESSGSTTTVSPALARFLGIAEGGAAPVSLRSIYSSHDIDVWKVADQEGESRIRNCWALGRLRPGRSEIAALALRSGDNAIRIAPYTGLTWEETEAIQRVGTLLNLAAVAIFAIACANVMSLLLGRATSRSQEISVCVALGASRAQLARRAFSDSFLVSFFGGVLAVLLSVWTIRTIPAFLFQADAESLAFRTSWSNAGATAAIAFLITTMCGLAPLVALPYDRPFEVLRRESAGASPLIRNLRDALAIAQMACCCILLTSTGFLVSALRTSLKTTAGQRLGEIVLATVQANSLVGMRYFENVEASVSQVPGVSRLTWTTSLPGSRPSLESFRLEPREYSRKPVAIDVATFSTGAMDSLVLPPQAGRLFGIQDHSCRNAVLNVQAARQMFADVRKAVGRSIHDIANRPVGVVGVVAERSPNAAATAYLFDPAANGQTAPDRINSARFQVPVDADLREIELATDIVASDYFPSLGFALKAGELVPREATGCRIAWINLQAAERFFGGPKYAIGATVIDRSGNRNEIVGVVDAPPLGTFQRSVEPAIYFPMEQDAPTRMTLILKASDEAVSEIRRRVDAVPGHGPAPPIVRTFETLLQQTSLAPLRISTVILGAAATIGLILSLLGLYATLRDAARQRRRELAVRIALGAQRRHIIGRILVDGFRLAGGGALAGTVGSVATYQLLARIAEVGTTFWMWLPGPIILGTAVVLASVLPARRAALVDPLKVLRQDN